MKRLLPALAMVGLSAIAVTPMRADAKGGEKTYACGFDSTTGYLAPGANQAVHVGGVFTLTVEKGGAISGGSETISVDDGGAGPATCSYSVGSGALGTSSSPTTATVSLAGDPTNSSLCPPPDATLKMASFGRDFVFVYSNSSGFVGSGQCSPAGGPESQAFGCRYELKGGAGMSVIVLSPPLGKSSAGIAATSGVDLYSDDTACPVIGFGAYGYNTKLKKGTWKAFGGEFPNCPPQPPFSEVTFTRGTKTINITAPGLVDPVCEPHS